MAVLVAYLLGRLLIEVLEQTLFGVRSELNGHRTVPVYQCSTPQKNASPLSELAYFVVHKD